jgi:hypothetical protein
MRYLWVLAAPLAAVMVLASQVNVTYASFHCMRIYSVMGGLHGNNNIQFIELREDLGGQNFVGFFNASSKVQFFDAAGTLKATFTFPADVANGSVGGSILIGSAEFNAAVTTGDPMARKADFTFSGNTVDPLNNPVVHPIQVPAGKIVYASGTANCGGTIPVDSVAYGGGAYTGPTDYGSPAPALPSDNRALRLTTSPYADPPLTLTQLKPSNNSTEYGLSTVSTTSTMIATGSLTSDATIPRNDPQWILAFPAPSVGGIAEQPAVKAPPTAATTSGDHSTAYALGGVALAVVAAMSAAGWYVRRRRAV